MGNDLADWFPVLLGTGMPVPKTEIVHTDCELLALLFGKKPKGLKRFTDELQKAAAQIGFPLFLRSGHTSAKHDWLNCCYVTSAPELLNHVIQIIEYGELSSFVGPPCDTWAVRELLRTQPLFTAFHGMPVTKERRYFIKAGEVICHHPYWPIHSIQNPSVENWQSLLEESNKETPEEIEHLSELSCRVSRDFEDAWSLDWLFTERGWFAIDMARAKDSFHWPECANADQ